MRTFKLEMDYPEMSREQFREVFRTGLEEQLYALPYPWIYDLVKALEEIVKNFYDHANKKGVIIVKVDSDEMEFEAYDFGPGYIGQSEKKDLTDIIAYHKQHGSSLKTVAKECLGIGLGLIQDNLNNMKYCGEIVDATITIETSPHFHFRGKLTY